jgi:hypothetical protein
MPKTNAMALKLPAITRPKGELSFRMGAPPVPGKAVTAGNGVSVGAAVVAVGAAVVAVGAPVVAVAVGGAEVGVSVT